ncbi:Pyridoxamine 5'-phosphate oxidase [Actinacidiphila rubida]|uniref:Pyridoxamine 5'-phosphate oxidase n=1 Tax=Actinacidiphila rubida TaxID=310780 RepID=A0A1H8R9I0_9ACTN|nr:pyridoxamine 5'-phosphate oxidase family protein [Actinacidiphila rubida]SEO63022.1 Pyridoxamine 5'-phosphate oxidase [Actinacidiphila rubida]
MALEAPRPLDDRRHDTLKRLENDMDVWVSTASPDGAPYLVPLSFLWSDGAFLVSTPPTSTTARNLTAGPHVRLALGATRDVVLIDATAHLLPTGDLGDLGDAYARHTGWDPRQEPTPYAFFRLTPHRIQAWREVNELAGRTLMRDGRWLD